MLPKESMYTFISQRDTEKENSFQIKLYKKLDN